MGRIFLILKSSPGCQTLSNAWLTSKSAAVQNWWFSRALLMVSATRWHCYIVEWACLKPNWWFGIQSWRFDSLLILMNISFSSTFKIVDSRLIGQYDVTSVGFFPGLGSIMICACFNDLGQYNVFVCFLFYFMGFRTNSDYFCIQS
jgi:hypothetical protein